MSAQDKRDIYVEDYNEHQTHYTYTGRVVNLQGFRFGWNNYGWYYYNYYAKKQLTYSVPEINAMYEFRGFKNQVKYKTARYVTITFDSDLTENMYICKGDVKEKELIVNTSIYIGSADTYEWYEWVNNSWESRGSNSTYTVSIPEDNTEIDGTTMIYRCLASNASGTVEKLFMITPRALVATSQISRY